MQATAHAERVSATATRAGADQVVLAAVPRLPRRQAAVVILLVAAVAALFSLPFVSQLQADSYKALYDGRWIVAHGVPHHEALTVMAHGRSWIDEEWLAEVAYYRAWQLGGYPLVAALALAAVAVTYMVLAALMLRRGASAAVALASALVAMLAAIGWEFVRAQDLVLPLFALLLAVCVTDFEHARPQRRLLLLLPILVLWSNLHGSVLLGAALAVGYLMSRAVRSARNGARQSAIQCAVLAVLAGLTPFATPYGFTIIDYYREFAGNPAMAGMAAEWTSPRFPSFVFFQFAIPVAVALVAVLVAGRRGYRPSPVLIAFAAVTAAAGAIESGSIIWFGIAAATLVADVLRYLIPAQAQPRSITLALGVAAAGLAVIVAARVGGRSTEGYNTLVPARTVAAVTAYASHHPCTTIIADNLSSAALLWRSPALAGRLAFDARLEQYSPTALGRWQAFIAGDSLGLDHLGGGDDILVADRYYASVLVRRLERFPARARIVRTADTVAVVTQTRPRPGGVCGAPA